MVISVKNKIFMFLLLFSFCSISLGISPALEQPGKELGSVFVKNSVGSQLPLDLSFVNDKGEKVQLADFFKDNKPVVIVPSYYRCPRLCGLIFTGVRKLINDLNLNLGEEYQVVTVSFDHSEKSDIAARKAEEYHAGLKENVDASKWHFLVGEQSEIAQLMSTLGFRYLRDGGEFAHSAAIYVLTPEGVISQYFSGIDFSARDVRLALVEASQGVLGTALDHILLYCYRFDPTKGKYTVAVLNFARVVSIGTFLILAFLVIRLLRNERKARDKELK
jgi:protein SCO1/2